MAQPEWDIFERLEKLEEKTERAGTTMDALLIASAALLLAFRNTIKGMETREATEIKNNIVAEMRQTGATEAFVDIIEEALTSWIKGVIG